MGCIERIVEYYSFYKEVKQVIIGDAAAVR